MKAKAFSRGGKKGAGHNTMKIRVLGCHGGELPQHRTTCFLIDGKLDEEMLQPGNFLPMADNEGNHMQAKVMDISGTAVKMDFNHPLAGMVMHFDGKVADVRPATAEELAHGHVHGEGGHQH